MVSVWCGEGVSGLRVVRWGSEWCGEVLSGDGVVRWGSEC